MNVTGRITQVGTTLNGSPKTLASSISYLPYGGVTGLTYGNSLSLSQGYDNQYRSTSILVDPVLDRAYEYDANGNVTSLEDDEAAGSEALETEGSYTYDQYTNLLASVTWGQDTIVYDYDDNANTVSTNDRSYVYDSSNQLIEVWDGANQIAGYTYNGASQRIKKVTQSGTKIFHYDLKGHLIAETDGDGEMIAEYIYIGEKLLAMITKPSETEIVSYFHNDHLGTPLTLTNDNQTIVWKAAYTPFGGADISVQTVENPFRLPGQYYDSETGLHYNYFRYYDPTTGRYVTPDPIGLEGGINLFLYVRGNPMRWIDPFGLSNIIFSRTQGRLIVITERPPLAPTLEFPAANNAQNPNANPYEPGGFGPVPYGTFSMGPFRDRGNDPNSAFGIGSFYIFLPIQIPFQKPRPDVLLHSGRRDVCDQANRCGVQHGTLGCIRTTDEAIRILQFDPPRTITIQP